MGPPATGIQTRASRGRFLCSLGVLLAVLVVGGSVLPPGSRAVGPRAASFYRPPLVLVYHHLVPRRLFTPAMRLNGCILPVETFERQIDYLTAHGYQVLDLKAYLELLSPSKASVQRNGKPAQKTVLVTFDDGYESVYTYAFPILQRHHVPAVVFLITSLVRETTLEQPQSTPPPSGSIAYLTWPQIEEMQRSGLVTFQSHTHALHYLAAGQPIAPALLKSPADRVLDDLVRSRQVIHQHLGYWPDTVAYPYGAYNAVAARLARQAGFQYAFATTPRKRLPSELKGYALPRRIVFPWTRWHSWSSPGQGE